MPFGPDTLNTRFAYTPLGLQLLFRTKARLRGKTGLGKVGACVRTGRLRSTARGKCIKVP